MRFNDTDDLQSAEERAGFARLKLQLIPRFCEKTGSRENLTDEDRRGRFVKIFTKWESNLLLDFEESVHLQTSQ